MVSAKVINHPGSLSQHKLLSQCDLSPFSLRELSFGCSSWPVPLELQFAYMSAIRLQFTCGKACL